MKIIRTKTEAKGGITPQEKILLDEHAKKWIKIIERTEPINKEKITKAIENLYEFSGLKKPRVIIVESPYIMVLAGGLASVIWYLRKNKKTEDISLATRLATSSETRLATDLATSSETFLATDSATYSATRSATRLATDSATYLATSSETRLATDSATYLATSSETRLATDSATSSETFLATDSATRLATDSATRLATSSETDSATRSATDSATDLATKQNWLKQLCLEFVGKEHLTFALNCIRNWFRMVNGGNMWGQYISYLTASRDILGLDLPKLKPYEDCALEGGYRLMHEEFCIVSDFPKWIKKDENNRPHCATGSQMEWRDGFATYYLHGIRFEKELFEKLISHKMSFEEILAIPDVDQRNQAMRFVGNEERDKFLKHTKAEVLDEHIKYTLEGNPVYYKLYKIPKGEIFNEDTYAMWYTCPSTGLQNFSGVPKFEKVAEAMAWKGSNDEIQITAEDWINCVPLLDEA